MINMQNKNAKTLTKIQLDVLTGLMLGDGSLSIRKSCINPRLTIRRQISDLPYLQWQFEIFRDLCRDKAITTGSYYDKRYNKYYPYCNLETRYIPAFKEIYHKWYPNGKKIIPLDLKLNPLIIAVWICDDGNVSIKNKQRINIKFHTQGFNINEITYLSSLLDYRYKVKFKIQSVKNNKYIIVGHDHQSRLLLKDIDDHFPLSMSRKSNIWRNESVNFYLNEPKQFTGYNSKQIKENVNIFISKNNQFTIKSLCQDLNLFSFSKSGYFQPHTTIKRYILKNIKENKILILDQSKIISFNTPLIKNKNI